MQHISLVAFLGNVGDQYKNTRHNTAWLFSDTLPFLSSASWQSKFKGQYCMIERAAIARAAGIEPAGSFYEGDKKNVYFLKPDTFMNLSGESIIQLAQFYKIKPENILVVHDELEMAPGFVSLKWSGGLGGHNGLRSTKENLGTADFWRLRFGIGRPNHPDIAGYVLSAFTADERIILSQAFTQADELMTQILTKGPEKQLDAWKKKNCAAPVAK